MAVKKQKGTKCTQIETQRNEFCNYRFSLKHQIERNLESKKISRKGEIPIDVKIETQRNEFCSYCFPFTKLMQTQWKSRKEKLKKQFFSKIDEILRNPSYKTIQVIIGIINILRTIFLAITFFHHK